MFELGGWAYNLYMQKIHQGTPHAPLDSVDLSNMKPGHIVFAGGKLWGRCTDCGKIVQLDKFIFGSLHLCIAAREKRKIDSGQRRQETFKVAPPPDYVRQMGKRYCQQFFDGDDVFWKVGDSFDEKWQRVDPSKGD